MAVLDVTLLDGTGRHVYPGTGMAGAYLRPISLHLNGKLPKAA